MGAVPTMVDREPPAPPPPFVPAGATLDPDGLEALRAVKQRVLDAIVPSQAEVASVDALARGVIDVLADALQRHGVPVAFIEAQGSTGIKQTQLAGDSDVDLFIGIDPTVVADADTVPRKAFRDLAKDRFKGWIETILVPSLEAKLRPDRVLLSYAEHPYLTVHHAGVKFDVVFCFDIAPARVEASDVLSAMDRTPLHSKFVRDHLDAGRKNEVRLLKAFFKAQHVYGDKSACGPMGFIGYGLEILVHHLGSFENVLANLPLLETAPVDVFGRPAAALHRVPRFKDDFLVIIDPTDRNRNVGSSMDPRCFFHACTVAASFLARPDACWFEIAPLPAPENEDPRCTAITFSNTRELHYTVVRDKLYKLGNQLKKHLEREQTGEPRFGTVQFSVLLDDGETIAAMGFHCTEPVLPPVYEREGPLASDPPARVRKYLERNPGATVGPSGRYITVERRPFTSAGEAIAAMLAEHVDVKGLVPTSGSFDVLVNPVHPAGRRAIHVLKTMILPNEGRLAALVRDDKHDARR